MAFFARTGGLVFWRGLIIVGLELVKWSSFCFFAQKKRSLYIVTPAKKLKTVLWIRSADILCICVVHFAIAYNTVKTFWLVASIATGFVALVALTLYALQIARISGLIKSGDNSI
jgi:hypothetical protein